jgi:hypothetical protein
MYDTSGDFAEQYVKNTEIFLEAANAASIYNK